MMEADRAFVERINASRRQFADGELARLMKPAGEVLTLDGEGERDDDDNATDGTESEAEDSGDGDGVA